MCIGHEIKQLQNKHGFTTKPSLYLSDGRLKSSQVQSADVKLKGARSEHWTSGVQNDHSANNATATDLTFKKCGRGGGQVVSKHAFYSAHPSSNLVGA